MGEWLDISMRDYLADRGRTSGSALSMVATEPEAYGRWLSGKDDDRPTAAKGRGSYFHARLLEPDTIVASFAFYPSRAEALKPVMREVIGPRGGKSMEPTGEFEPQDDSPKGARTKMLRSTDYAKAYESEFLASAVGRTLVYPEAQPQVNAMVSAVRNHPEAISLLSGGGFEAEVTGHWTCPETGEPMRIRPDGIRPSERIWVELKSVEPRKGERLDTLDPRAVARWARQGWARKSALLHDGCRAITGDNYTGYWIVVEAREDDPRVSVVRDDCESDASLYSLGVHGDGEDLLGYVDLNRRARAMRADSDFRAPCVRAGVVPQWSLPGYMLDRMRFLADSSGGGEGGPIPPILGATPLEEYNGG